MQLTHEQLLARLTHEADQLLAYLVQDSKNSQDNLNAVILCSRSSRAKGASPLQVWRDVIQTLEKLPPKEADEIGIDLFNAVTLAGCLVNVGKMTNEKPDP
jgi:hypothetical protein